MSNQTEVVQDQTIFPIAKIGPLPLFYGDKPESMRLIEAQGYNDYYIIANRKIQVTTSNNSSASQLHPTIFRVSKTVLGKAVVPADEKDLGLGFVTDLSATYFMPKMPWNFVKQMDSFFRQVYDKIKTEAILILYYDPTYFDSENPSDGWYCIAPKQKNTSHACDYDPSDAHIKKRNEYDIMMGTIHSHPQMDAYFSSTDHKDQADWDGIHITQAWKGNGATEYYIAMILGDKEWKLNVDQVFDTPPLPKVDDSIVSTWIEDVSVSTPAYTVGGTSGYSGVHAPSSSFTLSPPNSNTTPKAKIVSFPPHAPDPRTHHIIPRYKDDDEICRACKSPIFKDSKIIRRCFACTTYLLFEGEDVSDIVIARTTQQKPYDINIDIERSPVPIVIWELDDTFSDDQRTSSPKE